VNNTSGSDFWIRNTSYLRLKNASFGYTIPSRITQAIKIKNIRLYVGGQNLITFSNLKFMDPETSYSVTDGTAYPNMKSYTFGANITF
jgi:hypothetical protein